MWLVFVIREWVTGCGPFVGPAFGTEHSPLGLAFDRISSAGGRASIPSSLPNPTHKPLTRTQHNHTAAAYADRDPAFP